MQPNLRVFYMSTFNLSFLCLILSTIFDNSSLTKITINDRIPYRHISKRIIIVNTSLVRNRHRESDQAELIFETIYKLNILDVIVNKLLMILSVQFVKILIFGIVELLFTKDNMSNIVKSIAFLCPVSVRKFSEKVKIVKLLYASNFNYR